MADAFILSKGAVNSKLPLCILAKGVMSVDCLSLDCLSLEFASPNVIIGSKQNAAIAEVFPKFHRNMVHSI